MCFGAMAFSSLKAASVLLFITPAVLGFSNAQTEIFFGFLPFLKYIPKAYSSLPPRPIA